MMSRLVCALGLVLLTLAVPELATGEDREVLLEGSAGAYDISARGWLETPDSLRAWYLRGYYVSQRYFDNGLKCPERLSLAALLGQVNASVAQVVPDQKDKVPVALHVVSALYDLGCRVQSRGTKGK